MTPLRIAISIIGSLLAFALLACLYTAGRIIELPFKLAIQVLNRMLGEHPDKLTP